MRPHTLMRGFATVAAFGTAVMALYAKRPFAIAPYMGENAFIAFTVVMVRKNQDPSPNRPTGESYGTNVWVTRLTNAKLINDEREPQSLADEHPHDFLRLRAEMRVPGRAWLEMRAEPTDDGGSIYRRLLARRCRANGYLGLGSGRGRRWR